MESIKNSSIPMLLGAVMTMNLLIGCQGESGEGSTPDHTHDAVTYAAQDTVRQTTLTEHYYVDLQQNMSASNGETPYLNSVLPLSDEPECRVQTTTLTGFSVSANTAKACFYSYTVSGISQVTPRAMVNEDGSGTGTVSVVVGSKTELLSPVSAVTIEDTTVNVDPKSELGTTTYGDLELSSFNVSSVSIINTGTSSGSTVSTDGTTITYTPGPGVIGFERVLYSLNDGSNVLMGTIDIAISTDVNKAPEAKNFHYQHDGHYAVNNGIDEEIDVRPYIMDADGDTLQLIEVHSYNGDITPLNDEQDNTKFTFNSNTPGVHSITYVVTDHRGGYASGVISLTVRDVYGMVFVQIGPEPDDGDDFYFAPPYTANQAEEAGVKYEPSEPGDGVTALKGLRTATHDWAAANGVCMAKGGSLPSTEHLMELYKRNPNGFLFYGEDPKTKAKYQWPLDLSYWSRTESSGEAKYQTVNLANGKLASGIDSHEKHYVACLSRKAIKVQVNGPESVKVVPGSGKPIGTASYSLTSISSDGVKEDLYPEFVNWEMKPSDPYFTESGTVKLHPEEGSFDYYPENNARAMAGNIAVKGCDKDRVCDTKVTTFVSCEDLSGPCLDVFDSTNGDGTGKLFTNSPSVPYLDAITVKGSDWASGEVAGFYTFTWDEANEICWIYNNRALAGRTNWQLTTKDELFYELYRSNGEVIAARGWPFRLSYWSTKSSDSYYYYVSLSNGTVNSYPGWNNEYKHFVSCVSNP